MSNLFKIIVPVVETLIGVAADAKTKSPRTDTQLPIKEAAGELADRYNITCEPYRAPVMTADEAKTAGLDWMPLDNRWNAKIRGYSGSEKFLHIPSMIDGKHIVEIGFAAFAENNTLKQVYIPDGVKTIGGCAFSRCDELEYVRMPNKKNEYPYDIFLDCPKLLKRELQKQIDKEGRRTTALAKSLYRLDDKTAYIGSEIERAPYDETVYYVANGLINMGRFDFRGKGEAEVRIPRKIGDIEVTAVGCRAFHNDADIRRVYVPDSVKLICENAFADCPNLEYVRIPKSLDLVIEEGAVVNCPRLLINAEAAEEPSEPLTSEQLTEPVKKVKNAAELMKQSFMLDDRTAYYGDVIDRDTYSEEVYHIADGTVYRGYFRYQGTEEEVRIPRRIGDIDVTTISGGAFDNNKYVKRVYIPDSVKKIRSSAFCGCFELEYVRIPNDPDLVIEEGAIVNCPKLLPLDQQRQIAEEGRRTTEYAKNAFKLDDRTKYEGGEIERAPYDEAIYYVANGYLNTGCFDYRGKGKKEVRVPRRIGDIDVTVIQMCAFDDDEDLRRVYLPDSVRRIEKSAFMHCPNLEYVRIPKNPELVIEEDAFKFCPKLVASDR